MGGPVPTCIPGHEPGEWISKRRLGHYQKATNQTRAGNDAEKIYLGLVCPVVGAVVAANITTEASFNLFIYQNGYTIASRRMLESESKKSRHFLTGLA